MQHGGTSALINAPLWWPSCIHSTGSNARNAQSTPWTTILLNSTTRTRHGPDTDRTRTKSTHVVEYELNSTTQTRTRTRHGPDTDKVRARCRVRAKFHYTDPTGPARTQRSFAAKKVRAGPCGSGRVRVVEFSSSPTMCSDFVRVGSGPCRVRVGSV